jgi:ELWxxDGT repeat protein
LLASGLSVSLVADILPSPDSSGAFNLINANGALYFAAINSIIGQGIYKSDGTASGTVLVTNQNVPSFGIEDFTPMNGSLFFTGSGHGLWKTDGTAGGTGLVYSVDAGNLAPVAGRLFFAGSDSNGEELWVSDGTPTGTTLLKDIYPGTSTYKYKSCPPCDREPCPCQWVTVTTANSSSPRWLTDLNGTLFFAATDPTYGRELWRSDGTPGGTVLVKDIANGSQSSNPQYLTVINGVLYFSAAGGLWRSDGTATGTVLVKQVDASFLTNVNGTLFFVGNDQRHGSELWKSDGTAAGTVLVKDIVPGKTGGLDQTTHPELTNVNGRLYFQANDGVHGWEPWTSDGTAAGTFMLEDINQGPGSSAKSLFLFADVNGLCYFDAYDPIHGNELWQSDGTTAGTVLVQDMYPGSQGSVPTDLTSFNNKLYFFATDPDHGRELWDPPPVGNPASPGYAAGPLVEISNPDPLPNAPPGFSGTNVGAEPYVAVNPANPKNIAAVWMDHPFSANAASVTFDGGTTWQSVPIPISQYEGGPYPLAGEPWASFAPNGDLYASPSTPSSSTQPSPAAAVMQAPSQATPVDVVDQFFAQWETALSLNG